MNRFVLLLLVTSIALGAVTLHLVRELRNERDNAQTLQARMDALERAQPAPGPFSGAPLPPSPAAAETSAPIEESRAPTGLAAATVPAAALTSAPMTPSREERMRMIRESAERQRALMRDPDYRDALLTRHKMMFSSSYPDLAAELQFTPEEADQLTTLLANQQLRSMEDQEAPWFDGPPDGAAMAEMQRKDRERQQANEAEIAALLGQDKLAVWKEYQSTLGARQQAAQMRNSLASKGAPLLDDQIKPLQRAFADAQQRMVQEWRRDPPRGQLAFSSTGAGVATAGIPDAAARLEMQEDQLRRQDEHNQRLRDSLASILTLEQLQYFEEEQNAQLKIQQAHLRVIRAQAEAEARGEISSPTSSNSVLYSENALVSSP